MCMMIKDKYIDPFTDFGSEENKRFLISFLNDLLNDSDEYLEQVKLKNKKNTVFYDKLTYYYIQIPKFQKQEQELSNHLEYWLYYLSHLAKCQSIPKTLEKDELIKDAFNVAEFLALSKDEQFAYQLDLKAKLDYKNVVDYAKEEAEKKGMEKGFEQGIKQRNLEIAKSLLDVLDVEVIALKTGLSVTEVQRLKDNK